MSNWTNADGLTIYYGASEATPGNAGEYHTAGFAKPLEVQIDLATLTETETAVTRVFFPKDVVLWKVEVLTDEVAATGAAIDVGFLSHEGTPVVNDPNGILAALPAASMSALGETFSATADNLGTYGGAMIGTVCSSGTPLTITASRTTATAFTTGVIKLTLHWYRSSVR